MNAVYDALLRAINAERDKMKRMIAEQKIREEQERMRQLQEQMERERRAKEDEERKQRSVSWVDWTSEACGQIFFDWCQYEW